jgi:hypothetical protein
MVVLREAKSRDSSLFSTVYSRTEYGEKRAFLGHFRLTLPPPGGTLTSFLQPFFRYSSEPIILRTWIRRSNN